DFRRSPVTIAEFKSASARRRAINGAWPTNARAPAQAFDEAPRWQAERFAPAPTNAHLLLRDTLPIPRDGLNRRQSRRKLEPRKGMESSAGSSPATHLRGKHE